MRSPEERVRLDMRQIARTGRHRISCTHLSMRSLHWDTLGSRRRVGRVPLKVACGFQARPDPRTRSYENDAMPARRTDTATSADKLALRGVLFSEHFSAIGSLPPPERVVRNFPRSRWIPSRETPLRAPSLDVFSARRPLPVNRRSEHGSRTRCPESRRVERIATGMPSCERSSLIECETLMLQLDMRALRAKESRARTPVRSVAVSVCVTFGLKGLAHLQTIPPRPPFTVSCSNRVSARGTRTD